MSSGFAVQLEQHRIAASQATVARNLADCTSKVDDMIAQVVQFGQSSEKRTGGLAEKLSLARLEAERLHDVDGDRALSQLKLEVQNRRSQCDHEQRACAAARSAQRAEREDLERHRSELKVEPSTQSDTDLMTTWFFMPAARISDQFQQSFPWLQQSR